MKVIATEKITAQIVEMRDKNGDESEFKHVEQEFNNELTLNWD